MPSSIFFSVPRSNGVEVRCRCRDSSLVTGGGRGNHGRTKECSRADSPSNLHHCIHSFVISDRRRTMSRGHDETVTVGRPGITRAFHSSTLSLSRCSWEIYRAMFPKKTSKRSSATLENWPVFGKNVAMDRSRDAPLLRSQVIPKSLGVRFHRFRRSS